MKKSLKVLLACVALICAVTLVFTGCGQYISAPIQTSATEITVKVGEVKYIAVAQDFADKNDVGQEAYATYYITSDANEDAPEIEYFYSFAPVAAMAENVSNSDGSAKEYSNCGNFVFEKSETWAEPSSDSADDDYKKSYDEKMEYLAKNNITIQDVSFDDIDEETLNFVKSLNLSDEGIVVIYAVQGCKAGTVTWKLSQGSTGDIEASVKINVVE